MIPRYEVKEVTEIWSESARFKAMLEVEMALLRALEKKKRIPAGIADQFRNVEIRPDRIREIEETTKHDVIAFCTSITEQANAEAARFFHFGVTSSDILDTALSLQLRYALNLTLEAIQKLVIALEKRIDETQDLLCMGRSHGMAAEPMVFAQKFLSHQVELKRRMKDYQRIATEELTGQLSGAVGNYTVLDSEIETLALTELRLKVEPVSTQVIPRDHLAKLVTVGALTAAALERLAVEIRHLHHSDVGEVHEGFSKGQKGSSTMPHKKNPVSGENITGLSRMIRSQVSIALENVVLWHERDISHSSAERLYLPDHFGLLVYSLRRMTSTIENLEIHRDVIQSKVEKNFTTLSSAILHQLIEENAVPREELYGIVQEVSFQSKSLDEWLSLLQTKLQAKNLKWNAAKFNGQAIRQSYFEQFQKTRERVKKES